MVRHYLILVTVMISSSLWGQQDPMLVETANQASDILTNSPIDTNACASEIDTHESCQGFAESLVPKKYKEDGWKTLLEIKYQAIDKKENGSIAEANFKKINFFGYRNTEGGAVTDLKTDAELASETAKIKDWYNSTHGISYDDFDIRTQLIIEQIQNPTFTKNDADMMNKIKTYSSSMNDQEFTRFVSSLAGFVYYNNERAAFQQTPRGGLGIVTPFEQMTRTKSGICGDIHSMAAKMGEQRGWEAFTVGYALQGNQHVVTAMVNPKDPNKLMIVNYGHYEEQVLNDGNSVSPTPTSPGWEEMGTQMRIFKNDKTGDPLGKMQQIATVPTALGSFMNDLFKKDYQISKAMPDNQNFRSERLSGLGQTKVQDVQLSKDENKITDKLLTNGFIVYEGETDNAHVYGVAVAHDVYKDIYRWDPKVGKCVLKKNKYFSSGLATSLVGLSPSDTTHFYAYLNMKGGQIYHVYQSEYFQFKGLIGYEFEGFMAGSPSGVTGDANFATLLGVVADYNKKGTSIHLGMTYEASIALRNQNLMTDLSSIPSNINPLAFNAVSLDGNLTHKIDSKNTFVTNNNLTMTRVGGRVMLSTGIIHKDTSIMMSYQGGFKPLPIGNTLQNVNLLQNFNNMDGLRLSASQNFSNKKGTFAGTISGYGGISTDTLKPIPMAGASLKLNIGGKKRRPSGRQTNTNQNNSTDPELE